MYYLNLEFLGVTWVSKEKPLDVEYIAYFTSKEKALENAKIVSNQEEITRLKKTLPKLSEIETFLTQKALSYSVLGEYPGLLLIKVKWDYMGRELLRETSYLCGSDKYDLWIMAVPE